MLLSLKATIYKLLLAWDSKSVYSPAATACSPCSAVQRHAPHNVSGSRPKLTWNSLIGQKVSLAQKLLEINCPALLGVLFNEYWSKELLTGAFHIIISYGTCFLLKTYSKKLHTVSLRKISGYFFCHCLSSLNGSLAFRSNSIMVSKQITGCL